MFFTLYSIALIDLAWKSNKPVYLVLLHSYDDNFSYDDPNIEKKAIQDAFAILDFRSNHTNMDGILVGDFLMDVRTMFDRY